MAQCQNVMGFHTWKRTERVRDFQPPWRTVYIYVCPSCKQEHRIRQNWKGSMPPGAFICGAPRNE